MKKARKIFILSGILFIIGLFSCNTTKYVPANDALYKGGEIKMELPENSSKKNRKIKKELDPLLTPKPNKRVLGIPFKLIIYNLAGNPKKRNSLIGKLKYNTGEAPVLLSQLNMEFNQDVLRSYLENKGFFQANVLGDTIVKNRKAIVRYVVKTGVQYTIRSVNFDSGYNGLTQVIQNTAKRSLLNTGDHFDFDVIKAERERIDIELKDSGFYYFNPDYLLIKVDSTIGNDQVNLYVKVKPETPAKSRKRYTIDDVFILTNYSINTAEDSSRRNAILHDGLKISDRRNLFKPKMFDNLILFRPGDRYNRSIQNLTINRLITMGLFKFVNNRFEDSGPLDSSQLKSTYYLTPFPRKSLRLELGANTKSNNLLGSQLTLSWRNRNAFRGGELLTMKALGGFEIQYSGQFKGYNTYRGGFETELSLPRFIIPFVNLNTKSGFVPRTNIVLAYEILNKQKLYTMNSFRAAYGYVWKESLSKEHQLNIVSINFVQPIAITQEFIDSAANNPTLQKAVEKQFILGSTYNFTYDPIVGKMKRRGIYYNFNLDLSGNIPGLISGANAKEGKVSTIFNAAYSQYVKMQHDVRYYIKTGANGLWANRLIVGVGLPYGNSRSMPFIKQFFAGGNNSLRAFRSRSVGPGTYLPPDAGENNFYAEQSGDIKLEANTEIRAKLFSVLHGALFIDAGNIWLLNEDSLKPGAKFTNKFFSEMAVGAGAGLRVDVSFIVVRLDVAFPLRKPFLPTGERWVFDQINFGDPAWRKQNIIFNLAIGYPF
jgi:outer membrane protein assembly factor BamA